ncbi:MAG: NAD(P)H-dependent oxidoreductase [Actinomycetota bacterium]
MTSVVVQAHPVPDSLNGAMLERVVAGLTGAGIDHRVFRLGQGPAPTPADLDRCDELILVYPTWWGGQPAMLLAWLQELLEDTRRPLSAVEGLTAVTSLGSSRLLNRVQGEWGRRFLQRTVRSACAPSATFDWVPLYKVDRQEQPAIDAHLDQIEARFGPGR